jgi:NADH-quinone oxidoreductase subunit M
VDGIAMKTDDLSSIILTLVTFAPLVGALLLMFLPRRDRDIRIFSLVISLLTFVLSLHLAVYFRRGQSGFQFAVDKQWITTPNIHYHMAIDGISLWLVVLTTFLTPLCVLISWKSIQGRVKDFRDGDDWRLHLARSISLLLLLGSHAHPDGAADRDFRP